MVAILATGISCSDQGLIPMQVTLSRSVSKLPFVIALDQGLYEKYGLDIEVRMEDPAFEGGIWMPSNNIFARIWRGLRRNTWLERKFLPNIKVSGANSAIVYMMTNATASDQITLAATDCVLRTYIVAKEDIKKLEDLKGKRLGISSYGGNTGFAALMLAERMGWDPTQDISLLENGNHINALQEGLVDAFFANERSYFTSLQDGMHVLAATSEWDTSMAGNSVIVDAKWLEDSRNREATRRFLQAAIEGIAIFHQDRELVLDILAKWHGITDRAYAESIYENGKWIPSKPYPCYDGIINTMHLYDSNEMRKHSPKDFYDDSLMRELDESGFIDSLYETVDIMVQ
jgi:ABC-type nitrate/sulfonate/bicarbonate transport system substrate-binding protein